MAIIRRKNIKHNVMCYLSSPSWSAAGQNYSYYKNVNNTSGKTTIVPVLEKNDPTLCTVFLYSGKRYYTLYNMYKRQGNNLELKVTGYSFVYGFNIEGDSPSNFGIKHNWDNKESQFTNIKSNIIKIIKDTFASDPVMNTALIDSIKSMVESVFGNLDFINKVVDLANKAMSLLINSHYVFPEKEIPSYNGFTLESDEYTVKKVYCAYMSGFDPYAAAMEDLYSLDLAPSLYGSTDIGTDTGDYCKIAQLYYNMTSSASSMGSDSANLVSKTFNNLSKVIFDDTLKLFLIWAADHRLKLSPKSQGDQEVKGIEDNVEVYYIFGGDYDELYGSIGEVRQEPAPAQVGQGTDTTGIEITGVQEDTSPPPPPQEDQTAQTLDNRLGNWLTSIEAVDRPETFNIGFFSKEDFSEEIKKIQRFFIQKLKYGISITEENIRINTPLPYEQYLARDVYSKSNTIQVYSNSKKIIATVVPRECAEDNKNKVNYDNLVKAIYNPFLLKPIIIGLDVKRAKEIKNNFVWAPNTYVKDATTLVRVGARGTETIGSIDSVAQELIEAFQMLLVLPPGDYNYIPYFRQLIEALYIGAPSVMINGMNYYIGYYGIIFNNSFRFSFSNRLNDTILYLLPTSVKITASDVYVYPYTIRNVNVIGDPSLESKTEKEKKRTNVFVEGMSKAAPLHVTLTIDFRPINDYIHLYGNFLGLEKLLARMGSSIGQNKSNTETRTTNSTSTDKKALTLNLTTIEKNPKMDNRASLVFYNSQYNSFYAAKYIDENTWAKIQELTSGKLQSIGTTSRLYNC